MNEIVHKMIAFRKLSVKLTPSSFPCNKCTAPDRWIPGKNHTGCVRRRRSTSDKSHGGLVESAEVSLDVSPSAKTPPSELDTREARDWKKK